MAEAWKNRIVGYADVPPDQLLANPANFRRHPKEQSAALSGLIDEIGYIDPVLVQHGTDLVIDGHLRIELAMRTNQPTIPVKYVDLTDEETALALATFDPISAMAYHDQQALDALLAEVSTNDEDVQALLDSLAGEVEITEGLTDPDDVPAVPDDPITRPGDVWILGNHSLMCGDCRDFGDVTRLFAGNTANVVITSPPYASQRKYDKSSGFKPIRPDDYVEWFRDVATNIMAVLAYDGSYFLNIKEHCDDGQRSLYVKDLTLAHVREWGWKFVDELCWRNTANGVPGGWPNRFKNAWEPIFHFSKNASIKFNPDSVSFASDHVMVYSAENRKSPSGSGFTGAHAKRIPGNARPSNVIEAKAETGQSEHSAPFPVSIPEFFINAFSNNGDSVYDPFLGSGTTMIAAEQLGRTCYGMEISPAYCDVIVRRWEQFTGGTATRERVEAMAAD